jgi:hypothetical protein
MRGRGVTFREENGMTIPLVALFVLIVAAFAASPAHADPPGAACHAACRRLDSCKLMSFGWCVDYCMGAGHGESTADARAKTLKQAQSSCAELAGEMSKGGWLCRAEGESIASLQNGCTPSTVSIVGNGPNRDQAALKAMENCQALMRVDLVRAQTNVNLPEDKVRVIKPCRVTDCFLPGAPTPPAKRKR